MTQLPLVRCPVPGELAWACSYATCSYRTPRTLVGGELLHIAFSLRPGQEVLLCAEIEVPEKAYVWESLVWDFETRQFGWVQSFCLETDL